MNTKNKLRLNVLNGIVAITFLFAIIFTFIDVQISYFLLLTSFIFAVFTNLMSIYWSKLKQFKQKENGKKEIT